MQRINLEFLNQYDELNSPGQPDVKVELIERFFAAVPIRLNSIQAALRAADPQRLRYEAHALKNIAGNLGAEIFAELCLNLEGCAVESDWQRASSVAASLYAEFIVTG